MNSDFEIKPYSELTLADFRRHPVWTWYESDGVSHVITLAFAEPLSYEEYGVAFILTEFTLNDGTKLDGYVSVHLGDKRVYALWFYQEGKSFQFVGRTLAPSRLLPQLSEWLDKPITAITPLQFRTPATFEDGEPIEGEPELRDW